MKKTVILISALLLWLSLSPSALAENFDITNYDIEIRVDKNKSAIITETIDANFFNPSHGIYRKIPLKNATITNIRVSEQNQQSHNGGAINIKIGDPLVTIKGPHQYVIQYQYSYYDGKDEFYHNIIGTEWKTNINSVTFRVVLPEPIDSSKVGLSIGKYGTAGFDDDAVYRVEGNVISGMTNRVLSPNEGITLRVEVPHGYFNLQENPVKKFTIPGIFVLTMLAFMIWFIYGKDEPITPFVNFYPPKELNAIENELAYKGKASTKGIVALLIELAQKGYIKIETHGKDWALHKLKEPTDLDNNQSDLMNAIFGLGEEKIDKLDLELSGLFYRDCQDIIDDVNKKRNKIFYASSTSFSVRVLMYLCTIGLLFFTALSIFDFSPFKLAVSFPLLLLPTIAILVLISKFQRGIQSIFLFLWAVSFGGMPFVQLIFQGLSSDTIPTTIFGAFCLVVAAICTYQLPKRNPRGQRFLNHLEGLKKFIEVAEKTKLEQLVEQDPQYFYNILPSAYILGVSDKWIKQFESIIKIDPQWYSGGRMTSDTFGYFVRSFSSLSVPTVSNGGISRSSGGGGFSGGGGGGGGGGSW